MTFAGQVSHDAVPTMLAAMDVAVLPADHRRHASPMKLLEYMAMGRAIVAPRIANIEEILTEGSDSLLFEPDNVDDLAACISRLLADPTLRQSLGTAARRKVESGLTWDANAQRIVQIYEGTLRAPNSVLHIRN